MFSSLFWPQTTLDAEDQQIYCYTTEKIAEYMHKSKIQQIILIDSSARSAYIGIKRIWANKYPNTPQPDIYFINPKWLSFHRSASHQFNNWIFKHSKLLENKHKSLLVFDTCIHDGDTMESVKSFLEKEGFEKIKIWVWHNSNYDRCKIKPDLTIFSDDAVTCYPFGHADTTGVRKTSHEIVSALTDIDKHQIIGRKIREQIIDIMNDYIGMKPKERKSYVQEIKDIYV